MGNGTATENPATTGGGTVPVDVIYGPPLAEQDGHRTPTRVVPADVAALFARAHALVHRRPAAAHLGNDQVQAYPAPTAATWTEPDDVLLDRLLSADRPVMLAGPGVVRSGAVAGLQAVAAAAQLGVLNTWGAKGIFDWRSRHHLATAGLQERDFLLGGLGEADLIVAVGVDPAEAGGDRWRLAPVVDVDPGLLGPLAERWRRPATDIPMPPLRSELARVTQAGWTSTSTPLTPTQATRNLAAVVGGTGFVAAEPGTAGYWVARTVPTTGLGTVFVPGDDLSGLAVAAAAVVRLEHHARPVIAVVDGPPSERVLAAWDAAASLGASIALECWADDGDELDHDAHLERLQQLAHSPSPRLVTLRTDPAQMDQMVEAAGSIMAWRSGVTGR